MFGYIRPAYPELKLREYEAYRACYCGLCRALGSRYGLAARMILNYDFVLLVMLLWQPDEPVRFANARCPVKLCRKRPYCRSCAAMEKSAAMSVILAYHKLRDDVRDGGLWKRLGARAASRLLRRAYRKAAGEEPDFDRRVRQSLDALTALETAGETSLDRTADTFAGLLSAAAADQTPDSRRRAMEQTNQKQCLKQTGNDNNDQLQIPRLTEFIFQQFSHVFSPSYFMISRYRSARES